MSVRPPVFAYQGWYSSDARKLRPMLQRWLDAARQDLQQAFNGAVPVTRAIIAPHAGLAYCGATSAHGFATLDPQARRAILIGPAHRYWHGVRGPAVVGQQRAWETPIGQSPVDMDAVKRVVAAGVEAAPDELMEEEHCLEMELPLLQQVLGEVPIVPILLRSRSEAVEAVLRDLLSDGQTVCVVSSDFCHFGSRFSYVPPRAASAGWAETIRALDMRGAELAAALDAEGFDKYIKETENTICGRFPISAFLHAAPGIVSYGKVLHYSQSNEATSPSDGSVSYCSICFW